jgi:plasmid stabilization system protein ParE
MKAVRFHPEVADEIAQHKSWYEQRSEVAAQGFLLELERAINAVAESPERWPIAKRAERRYVFPRYPFALLYRVHADHVYITAVAHQSRRPGYWRHRK